MSPVEVDVIIVNYRGAPLVAQALERLRSQGPWPYGRLWVVDNSEDPGHAGALRQVTHGLGPDVTILTPERNRGFGAGCNTAWGQSTAPYVLLLNPDAAMEPGAVAKLAGILHGRPQMAAISPRTWWDRTGGWLLPCPTPQQAVARLRRAWGSRRDPQAWASEQARQTVALLEPAAAQGNREARGSTVDSVVEVRCLAGAVMMLRRAAVQACGGLFDESFFMYFEDAELSDRLRAHGWHLGLAATVDAVHTWRHEPHKAALMDAGQAQYVKGQGWAYRWLRRSWPGLESMGYLGAGVHRFAQASEAAEVLGPVRALSPVPSGDPACVRSGLISAPLVADEWALLAPGHYWAWTTGSWVGFERL